MESQDQSHLLCTVESENMTYSIVAPTPDQPMLWYGPYQSGKLAVYSCAVTSKPELFIQALVYSYADAHDETLDGMGYLIFKAEDPLDACVNALLDELNKSYIAKNVEQKDAILSNGYQLQ